MRFKPHGKIKMQVKCAVQSGGRERQSLLKVFLLEVRILCEQLLAIGISRQNLQYAPYGDSHARMQGLPPILSGSIVIRSKGGFTLML